MRAKINLTQCVLTMAATIAMVAALPAQVTPARTNVSATGTTGPEKAPVTMVVFSDFACPYSAELFFTLEKVEKRYPGQLRVVLKQSPLPIHPDAPLAHRAALAAGRQGRFREMAELLYANQTRQTPDAFMAYARQLHLDTARFRRDMDSATIGDVIAADIDESHALGIQLTPTLFLNGRSFTGTQSEDILVAAIQKAAAATTASPSENSVASSSPAVDDALIAEIQANPTAVQGSSDAPLTIVEFTDFQCPFCRSAVGPMQQLMAARGREVRWEFRAYPLDFHADAIPAAEAALAAGAQGKFWPMHDLLFAHQTALKPADLTHYAEQLGLDMKAFQEAMATHRYASQIAADRVLGSRAGVSGTPTFLIDGHLFTGALQLPELTQIADAHNSAGPRTSSAPLTAGVGPSTPSVEHQISGQNASTPLTLTWFTDVRSPLAARQGQLVRALASHYGDGMRVVYKAFPLATHPDGRLAGAALLAASAQNKFWPMFDALSARHDVLDRPGLIAIAAELHLESADFAKQMDLLLPAVDADLAEAARRGILGAPVMFLNTQRVDGLQREAFYTAILDRELKNAPVTQAQSVTR